MFGKTANKSQNENTIFNPQSPYGTAKVFAHQITRNYRDAYNIFALMEFYLIMRVQCEEKIL